jgi:hypothetical protein
MSTLGACCPGLEGGESAKGEEEGIATRLVGAV